MTLFYLLELINGNKLYVNVRNIHYFEDSKSNNGSIVKFNNSEEKLEILGNSKYHITIINSMIKETHKINNEKI